MLRHYFLVAFRGFRGHPLHSGISVLVLALGLTCFLAAVVFVLYLRNYDSQFEKARRTYIVYQESAWPQAGYQSALGRRSAFGIAQQLSLEMPSLEAVAREITIGASGYTDLRRDPTVIGLMCVDAAWIDIFNLDVVVGDTSDALRRNDAVILTERSALQLFGSVDAVGQTVTLAGQVPIMLTVAAVVEEPQAPSHLAQSFLSPGFTALASLDLLQRLYPQARQTSNVFANVSTYVVLPDERASTLEALNETLENLADRPLPEPGAKIRLEARHASTVAEDDLQKRIEGFSSSFSFPGGVSNFLLSLAALVLALACLNFANLVVARSLGRTREIGIRKAVGARKAHLVTQSLFETACAVIVGVAFSLLFLVTLVRLGEVQWSALIEPPFGRPVFWYFLAILIASVTILAGGLPAAVLGRIRPLTALRLGSVRAGPTYLRSALVVVQVVCAAVLCTVVLVAVQQAGTMRDALVGRFNTPHVILSWPVGTFQNAEFQVIADELKKGEGIAGLTAGSTYPMQPFSTGRTALSRMPDPAALASYESRLVAYDYFSVMNIPLLAGRPFSSDYSDGSPGASASRIVIDRSAAESLDWLDPAEAIGQTVHIGSQRTAEIVGVVESTPMTVLGQKNDGVVYSLTLEYAPIFIVRLTGGAVAAALEHIDRVWRTFAPNSPVQRQFLDEAFDNAYEIFYLTTYVLVGIAAFAVTIAVVGLFGMAAYVTGRRTREIGIRKTQGASAFEIVLLLLREFSRPVLLANALALPITVIVARAYTAPFAAQTQISLTPIIGVLIGSLVVTWVAVGGHVWTSARVNPVVALRE